MTQALLPLDLIKTVGLAGVGSVGASWVARLLANGYDVIAYDPDSDASSNMKAAVTAAWPVMLALNADVPKHPPFERVRFVSSLEELAQTSDLIQENVGEALAVKRDVLSAIGAVLPPNKLILSSSGGVPPSTLQGFCHHPERVALGHPFHPAYAIPLVEIVAGRQTRPDAIALAVEFYTKLGMNPICLQKEMVGHLTNRLQFALLREAVHCLNEGVASAADIDAAVRWGLGLRWAIMGPLMTFNLAGGAGGVEQIVDRFKDDIDTWWKSLGEPLLTDDVCTKLIEGVSELRQGISNEEWGYWRDDQLVELLKFRTAHPYLPDHRKDERKV